MPTGDEEDSLLGDFIEDDTISPPDDAATYNLLRENLREVLAEQALSKRSKSFQPALDHPGRRPFFEMETQTGNISIKY